MRTSLVTIEGFLKKRRSWIDRKIAGMKSSENRILWKDTGLSEGDVVHIRGVAHTVLLVPRTHRSDRPRLLACEGVAFRLQVPVTDAPDSARKEILRMYREIAPARLDSMLPDALLRVGAAPTSITFRLQRARWGSCSRHGRISLNLLCVGLPDPLFEYVLCHELCHLRHMDHGRGFWSLLRSVQPDMADRRKELRDWRLR